MRTLLDRQSTQALVTSSHPSPCQGEEGRGVSLANRGFTLIEVLIAVGILSIILLSVYGTFFGIHRALGATDGAMLKYREMRVFFDLLRREVESSFLTDAETDGGGTHFRVKDRDLFGKRISELSFTSFAPYGDGLYAVSYSVDAEKKTLWKSAARMWTSGGGDRSAVFEGIEEFQVEVLTSGRWVGTYDSALSRKLPAGVRVTLRFRDNDRLLTLRETMEPKLK